MYWWESCRHCFYYCKSNFTILICCQHSDSGGKLKFQLVKLNWFPSIKFTNTPDFYPGLRSPAFRVSSGHIQDTGLERFRERQDPTQDSPLQCRRARRDVSFLVVFVVVARGSYSEPVRMGRRGIWKQVHQLKFWFSWQQTASESLSDCQLTKRSK